MALEAKAKQKTGAAGKELTESAAAMEGVLDALREAGGGLVSRDDMVDREGDRYVIPKKETLAGAAKFLHGLAREEEEETNFSRIFNARPLDGAYCAFRVMREVFGAVGHHAQTVQGFFGPYKVKPQMRTINIGVAQTTQVPWGAFSLPGMAGCEITFHGTIDAEKGPLFAITVEGPKKYKAECEGLFRVIEEALPLYSIYKGKAIDGGENAEFIRIDIDPAKVVYAGDVQAHLQANVWSVIEDSDMQRAAGLPLKRSVLLFGDYGTGKSLFLGLTAGKATEHGWTYIRCRPGKDNYLDVLQTASLYAPSVVAFEDVDMLAAADASAVDVARLLDTFDGVTAKGREIIALLTTNHPEMIHKGMVRPGRLDAVIKIAHLDPKGIQRLIESLIPAGSLSATIDWKPITDACEGYMPAFIKEAADRATRYALSNSKKTGTVKIDTEDLVNAANGLRSQLELMNAAEDHKGYQQPLDSAFRRVVANAVGTMIREDLIVQSADEHVKYAAEHPSD